MFATLIHGDVAPNKEEEKAGYFLRKKGLYGEDVDQGKDIGLIDYQNSFPFAACTDSSSQCLLAFTNFDQDKSTEFETTSKSFSFLQVDNRLRDDYAVAGVISADGVAIGNVHKSFKVEKIYDEFLGSRFSVLIENSNFAPCDIKRSFNFKVMEEMYLYLSELVDQCKNTNTLCCLDYGAGCFESYDEAVTGAASFLIGKRRNFDREYEHCIDTDSGRLAYNVKDAVPIVILFPRVEDDNYPDTIRDVSMFLLPRTSQSTNSFRFEAKSSFIQKGTGFAPVGFNFLALSPLERKRNTKFGYIHGLPGTEDCDHRLYGIKSISIEYEDRDTPLQGAYANKYEINQAIDDCHQAREDAVNAADEDAKNDLNTCLEKCPFYSGNFDEIRAKRAIYSLVFNTCGCQKKMKAQLSREKLNAFMEYFKCIRDTTEILTKTDPSAEQVYSFPSLYYGYNGRFRSGRDSIREGRDRFGGVRVVFDEPFDTIPSVIVTPVLSDDSQCSFMENAEKKTNVNIPDLEGEFDRLVNIHGLLQCMTESISTEEAFVKCVCIKEEFIEVEFKQGEKKYLADIIEITPVPFNIVAVGPSNTQSENEARNVAKNGELSRSSHPESIDGSFDTNDSVSSSWEVDLGSTYNIEKIVVSYLKSTPLPAYTLSLINGYGHVVYSQQKAAPEVHDANPIIPYSSQETTLEAAIRGMKVRIDFNDENDSAMLVEVEVIGRELNSFPYNVAVGKLDATNFASNLVDGNYESTAEISSEQVWKIDLGQDHVIQDVMIHMNSSLGGMEEKVRVLIANKRGNVIFDSEGDDFESNGSTVKISVGGKRGQHVDVINIDPENSLELSEIEVTGIVAETEKKLKGDTCAVTDECSGGLSCGRTTQSGDSQCCASTYLCTDMFSNQCDYGQEYCFGEKNIGDDCYAGNDNSCGKTLKCGRDSENDYKCCNEVSVVASEKYCVSTGRLGDVCFENDDCRGVLECGRTSLYGNSKCCRETFICDFQKFLDGKCVYRFLNQFVLYCEEDSWKGEKLVGETCDGDSECENDLTCAKTDEGEKCCEERAFCENNKFYDNGKEVSGFDYLNEDCVSGEYYCKFGYFGSELPSTQPSEEPSEEPSKLPSTQP